MARSKLLNPRHDPQKFRDEVTGLLTQIRKIERRLRAVNDIDLKQHLEDMNNPHEVTWDQLLNNPMNPDAVNDGHEYARKNAAWWRAGVENHTDQSGYLFDELVAYEGTIYHCIQTHTAAPFSLDNFRPIAATVGTGTKFQYRWSDNTAGPIPNGGFAINTADALTATEVLVSGISDAGNDISAFWLGVNEGDYTGFAETTGGAEFCYFQITGPAVQTDDWFTIPVVPLPASIDGDPENNREGLVSLLGNPDNSLPAGGTAGWGLMKLSAASYDTGWRPFVVPGYGGIRESTPTPLADIGAGWTTLEGDTPVIATPLDVVQDTTNNTLAFSRAGIWALNVGFSLSHNELNASRSFSVRLFNVTKGVPGPETVIGIGRNTDTTTWSVGTMFELLPADVDDAFRIEVGGGDALTTVVQNSFGFSSSYISEWRGDA